MIELSQLNGADWVIIVALTVSTLLSLWRGFVREALSLLGWITAFVVAHLLVDRLAMELAAVIANVTGRYVAAYAILFVSTLRVFTIVVKLATSLVRVAGLSALDRVLGTIFGFARGVIVILVAVYVIKQLIPPQDQQWLHQSVLMPHLNMLADWVQTVFSNSVPGEQITT